MTTRATGEGDQLIATRYLAAPPALVWEVFTTPEHLATFWGGDHATVPPDSVRVDLRVGGTFSLETWGADGGGGGRLHFTYEELDAPRRLVLSEARTGLLTEIRLERTGDGTTVVVHQRRLPPGLQTEQARTGLAGVLTRLGDVVDALHDERRRGRA